MNKFLSYAVSFLLISSMHAEDRHLGLTSLDEELTKVTLEIKDEIPAWLNGTFVHNGPAKFNVGEQYVTHWFDGLAMLHAFQFNKGQVIYSNKLLHTTSYDKMVKEGSVDFAGFAQKSTSALDKGGTSEYYPNANINVAKYSDQYVALTEVPLPVVFDLDTLDTKGLFTYADDLPKRGIWESAHPHYDPATKEIINYFVEFGKESVYYIYHMVKGAKKREPIAQLLVDDPSYMHSFAITPHYIILSEFPFVVTDPKEMLKGKGSISAYHWVEGRPLRFLVINRKTGKLIGQYKTDGVFAFHHINSYEKGDELIIDMAAYPDASCITNPEGEDPENRLVSRFTRYHLSLSSGKVIKEQLGPSIEMPRINYDRFNGKPYEYVYGIDESEPLKKAKRRDLVKIDVKTKKLTVWSEDGCFASEPVFVMDPNGKDEDDGVILSVVLDTKKKRSFLLLLKADSFKEIGRAIVPHPIPFGLHGEYFKTNG